MSRKNAGPAEHNSRTNFKVESLNIHTEKSKDNWYWNCFTGTKEHLSFKKVETDYYMQNYTASLNARNESYKKQRHIKRCKTMEQYMRGNATKPEEHIIQIGDIDNTITKEQLHEVLVDYYKWHREIFPNVKFLDMAIHVDEDGAPHIHMRKVWECTGRYGKEICEAKALREMGVKRPDLTKEAGRYNNAKITYTNMVRDKLLAICIDHGIDIETEVKDGKAKHLQPNEFKLRKMKEEIEQATKTINEQQLQIEELEDKLKQNNSEFADIKILLDRFFAVYKKKNGIDLSREYNSFVESEKKNKE